MIGYKTNSVQRFLEGHNVHGHAEIAMALAKWLKDWEVGIRTPKSENPLVKTPGNCNSWSTCRFESAYNIDASSWQICKLHQYLRYYVHSRPTNNGIYTIR